MFVDTIMICTIVIIIYVCLFRGYKSLKECIQNEIEYNNRYNSIKRYNEIIIDQQILRELRQN